MKTFALLGMLGLVMSIHQASFGSQCDIVVQIYYDSPNYDRPSSWNAFVAKDGRQLGDRQVGNMYPNLVNFPLLSEVLNQFVADGLCIQAPAMKCQVDRIATDPGSPEKWYISRNGNQFSGFYYSKEMAALELDNIVQAKVCQEQAD